MCITRRWAHCLRSRIVTKWRIIAGYSGMYRVSESGRVQTCSRPGKSGPGGPWRDLSIKPDKYGYPLTYLWDSETQSRVRIHCHRLVADAFLERVAGLDCVNHLDGDKTNNHYSNLEWTTRKGNMKHAWETGLCKAPKVTMQIAEEIREYPANDTTTAKVFGVSQPWVTKIRANKAWING